MSFVDPRHSVTAILTGTVAKNRFVSRAGVHATSSDDVEGVSEDAGIAGKAISLVTGFSYLVEAAGAIAAGSLVGPASDGTGRAVAGGGCGRARTAAAAAGQMVVVELFRGGAVSGAGIQTAASRPWASAAPQALGGVGTAVPRHMVARGFSETSGLTLTNQDVNITGTMSIDTASPLGGTALKVNIVNSAGAARYVDVQSGTTDLNIPNFKGSGRRLVFRLAVDTPANCPELSTFVGTSGLANYWRRAHYPSTYQAATKMVFSTFPGPNCVADTVAATDTIRQYRFRIYVAAGAAVNFWIDALYLPEKTKGYWVWTADDQAVSLATIGSILAARGMHCSFGVNQSGITTAGAAVLPAYGSGAFSWTDAANLAAAGHEISSHNVTNTNVSGSLSAYMGEHRTMKWDLYQRGLLSAPYYHPCVQGVQTTASLDALLAEGVRAQRLVCADPCEPLFRGDYLASLPCREFSATYQLGSATTAGSMLSYLQEAIDYGVDQVGMLHLLDAASYAAVTWPVGPFTVFADAVAAAVSSGQIGGAGSIGEWSRYRGFGLT